MADSKQDVKPVVSKSATQIMNEQHSSGAPSSRMASTRRVYPIQTLNPYQGNWTIKVRVTHKGPMRTYKNARGEGNVFSVELTDEEGTQIQATMFKESADKFFDVLQLGKVYYISKGSLRAANKQFSNVKNDYEMNLNTSSVIEEVPEEDSKSIGIPLVKYNFVKVDELGPHVGGRELIDVIGVVQSVTGILQIRRKSNNEEIPKREVTIADQSQKTVVITLWSQVAMEEGAKLASMADEHPVIAVNGLRVGDFQGVSLSSTNRSTVTIDPDVPETAALKAWYEESGKGATLAAAGVGLPGNRGVGRSLYEGRAGLKQIVECAPEDGKIEYFTSRIWLSYIKPDQPLWYNACPGEGCNKKISGDSAPFRCEGCNKDYDNFRRRYVMAAKVTDMTGEGWVSFFNDQAEQVLGKTADEVHEIKENDPKQYEQLLKSVSWCSWITRISVAMQEYRDEKRQRVTIRSLHPLDWVAESNYLLDCMAKLKAGA